MVRIIRVLLVVLYLFGLVYIVFFARRRQRMHTMSRHELINIMPVINKVREFRYVVYSDFKTAYNFYSNILGNIILFIPFPILLFYLFRVSPSVKSIFISAVFSTLIECLQLIFKAGVADVDDILLNTSGAAVGVLFLSLYLKMRKHRDAV